MGPRLMAQSCKLLAVFSQPEKKDCAQRNKLKRFNTQLFRDSQDIRLLLTKSACILGANSGSIWCGCPSFLAAAKVTAE